MLVWPTGPVMWPNSLGLLSGSELRVFFRKNYILTELHKFEANIQVSGSRATVYGKGKASSQANATDLQGEISLVLASLSAEGITEISGTSHADRGYENLEMKLQKELLKSVEPPMLIGVMKIWK
uniref:UDP-N-acetylglucosamine 1-carboxyvinyltransferase n=1 Tax=Solanum lycopersicum TaxID=4081 RepID=A0A3Q7I4S4_SOLLC